MKLTRARRESVTRLALGPLASPVRDFQSMSYTRHTRRRQEHLATLELPLAGRSVLEVGAGVGDHTDFFLDRGCRVTVTDARPRNVRLLRRRFPTLDVRTLDLDEPPASFDVSAEITYCYGTLYHLGRPATGLEFMAAHTRDLLLLETCVSFGDDDEPNLVTEKRRQASQSLHGLGCRPTRRWVWNRLAELFDSVYMTRTQPWHPEFPTDWSGQAPSGLTRSVFVASNTALELPTLLDHIPTEQPRS
jgi:hypothetical protein